MLKAQCSKIVYENGEDFGKFKCIINDPIYGYDPDQGEIAYLGSKNHVVVGIKELDVENCVVKVQILENEDKIEESLLRSGLPWNSIVFID